MTNFRREFDAHNRQIIETMAQAPDFQEATRNWMHTSLHYEYSYHFTWMGIPIIQYPQDMVAMQEIIWEIKPDLIIETGVAWGGSLIFYASMLEMMGLEGKVIGVDIEIRPHNRQAIETHPLFKRITLLEGSSTDRGIVEQIAQTVEESKRVLVTLDSNHTHEHVLEELRLYSPFVTNGSYLVVFDTVVADMTENLIGSRPWTLERNPKSAVYEFLKTNSAFEIDKGIHQKLMVTVAPDGYLRRVRK